MEVETLPKFGARRDSRRSDGCKKVHANASSVAANHVRRRSSSSGYSSNGEDLPNPQDQDLVQIGGMFGGLQKLKHAELNEYNVFDYYKGEESWAARIARSPQFENYTLAVIAANAVWIGVDTDHNTEPVLSNAPLHFQIAENLFCVYFSVEVLIRFGAFKKKVNCLRDFWFKFDLTLVILMIVETWILPLIMRGASSSVSNLSMLRLLRLLRLTRLVRLMRSVPEVLTLIKGMAAASRSVASTMGLLVAFIYIFGIIFAQNYASAPPVAEKRMTFSGLPRSMLTLFIAGTVLDDVSVVVKYINDGSTGGYFMLTCFFVFVLLANFTILNMLIGILCEVVSATAAGEQERLIVSEAKKKLKSVFSIIDADGSGLISRQEFDEMSENEEATRALESLGVEPKHLFILSDTIFADDPDELEGMISTPKGQESSRTTMSGSGRTTRMTKVPKRGGGAPIFLSNGEELEISCEDSDEELIDDDVENSLSFEDFLEIVVHLRPGSIASVLDVADLRRALRQKTKGLSAAVKRIEEQQEKQYAHLDSICRTIRRNPTSVVFIFRRPYRRPRLAKRLRDRMKEIRHLQSERARKKAIDPRLRAGHNLHNGVGLHQDPQSDSEPYIELN